jgi:hypothetical protein
MKTIETMAKVTDEGKLIIEIPVDMLPGEHRTVLVVEEQVTDGPAAPRRIKLPSAYRRTAEEIEQHLARTFTPEQLAAADAADLSNLAYMSPSLSETLNEDREDRV